ncbi:MAG: hypothetical protein MUE42_04770 [Opitutaceae bacterium]|jgi:chromosome segregation ATPase|nr:hypothetical protein [Opitutaceae bacterium]
MNKLYLIVPFVLLLAFGGVYYQHAQQAEAKAALAAQAAAEEAAAAAAQKAEAERQAREDADRRTAERLAEEKRKEDEKRAKWEATGRQIADSTAEFRAQTAKITAEIAALEAELKSLRERKEAANQAVFDQDLAIERARVARRTAELELQRLVEMAARRAGTTLGDATVFP